MSLSFRFLSIRQGGLRNLLYLFPGLRANDSTVQFFEPFPALVELRASGFTSPDGFICSTENLFRYRSGYFVHICSCKQFVRKEQRPATLHEFGQLLIDAVSIGNVKCHGYISHLLSSPTW